MTDKAKRDSLLDRAIGLDETEDKLNVLYYGEQGTWKTSNSAAMAHLGQVLVVNAEGGLKRRPLQKLGIPVENLKVVGLTEVTEGKRYAFLENLYFDLKRALEDDPSSWAGVIWDSLTEIHKTLLDDVVGYALAKSERQGKERDAFFIDRADYGIMTEQMRLLLRRFRDLPCHFVITALERRDQDDDGRVSYRPAVTPALQSDVIGYVDIVSHTSVEEVGDVEEGWGLQRYRGKYRGKDRFGATPPRLIQPSFDRLCDYVYGVVAADDDPMMEAARERRRKKKEEGKKGKKGKSTDDDRANPGDDSEEE